jgi:hypothetical protein
VSSVGGHRALSWFSSAALTDWLGLRQKAQAWTKEQQRIAEAESLRVADSRLLIQAGSEAEEAYVEALGDEPPEEIVALVEQLEALDLNEREQAGLLISKAEGYSTQRTWRLRRLRFLAKGVSPPDVHPRDGTLDLRRSSLRVRTNRQAPHSDAPAQWLAQGLSAMEQVEGLRSMAWDPD